MIEVGELCLEHLPQAAALFLTGFRQLRLAHPILPAGLAEPDAILARLDELRRAGPIAAAFQAGRLVGYLGAFHFPRFRGTTRMAAYCPPWGHAAAANGADAIYRALYRSAAAHWYRTGCQVHAITLLSSATAAQTAWFWQGFGLTVVDAVRSLAPLGAALPAGLILRQAQMADCALLAELEAEHWQHYGLSPIFMCANSASSAADFRNLLADPANSAWLALDGDHAAGYLRFEPSESAVVAAPTTTAITGAFVRPAYRGRGAAAALLDLALREHAARGFERCSVDFESFNPEAAGFWLRYFEPVCYSLLRVPEKTAAPVF